MTSLTVAEAITKRKSTREYLDKDVPKSLIEEILTLAMLSPSGSNLQPWKIHVVTGKVKNRLLQLVSERSMVNPMGEGGDIPIYPEKLSDPWRQRRWDCGELMYKSLDITREDKMGRLMQTLKNFSFFGAPVGIILTMDRRLAQSQMIDLGLILQNIQLLAVDRGLDTCAQASWTLWPKTIREVLEIDNAEMVMVGLALGYADIKAAVNETKQPRIGFDEAVSLYGFES